MGRPHGGGGGVVLEVLCLRDPVEVAAEVLLDLLPLPVLLKVAARLGLLSLLGELAANGGSIESSHQPTHGERWSIGFKHTTTPLASPAPIPPSVRDTLEIHLSGKSDNCVRPPYHQQKIIWL